MKVQAIVPVAGSGQRFHSDMPKALHDICGKPVFLYALLALEKSKKVSSVVLVVRDDSKLKFLEVIKAAGLTKIKTVVAGGETRTGSVGNGLKVLDKDTQKVLIHDGVRPLITAKMVDEALLLAREEKALTFAVRVKPTIKSVDPDTLYVTETLNRDELWEIQTPQIFDKDTILKAHKQKKVKDATDDAALVEALGVKVKIIPGSYRNIKITTPDDIHVAETWMKMEKGR